MKKSKNILIIMLIVIEIVATYFMYKSSTNKEVVLDNVELKEIKKDGSFAIMVEKTEGSGTYEAYQSSTWPSNYNFNANKSSCINEKGEIVSGVLTFDESANKAYVTNTTQTTYCYLYFDLPITETVPTCTFNVTNTNGSFSITFSKSDNAKKWYVGNSETAPQDDSQYTNPLNPSVSVYATVYGYVKNSAGIGSCKIESKISQTSGCHSATAGGSSGDSSSTCTSYKGYCDCVNGSMRATITSSSQVNSCSGYSNDSCSGSCNFAGGTSQKTDYETCSCSSTGPSAGSTVWTCQYDTRTPYPSKSQCDDKCGPVAGQCDVGYTRIVGGAADGQAGSQALCYKIS